MLSLAFDFLEKIGKTVNSIYYKNISSFSNIFSCCEMNVLFKSYIPNSLIKIRLLENNFPIAMLKCRATN